MNQNHPPQQNPFNLFELQEAAPHEVCWRIEHLCLNLLRHGAMQCRFPDRRVQLCVDGALRLGVQTKQVSLKELVKPLIVLRMCHSVLIQGRTATTREIFYRNKSLGGDSEHQDKQEKFLNEQQCERTIQLCMYLVGVTRGSLGLVASNIGKGLVAGISISNPTHVHPIPCTDSIQPMLDSLAASPHRAPRFILIVEKHTVLHRIAQTEFLQRFPCLLVTGRGFPDLETRKFCRRVKDYLNIPCFGVCDLNPHGLAIMATYCYGSIGFAGESHLYTIPDLTILGMLSGDGDLFNHLCMETNQNPNAQYQHMTAKDQSCLNTLISRAEMMGDVNFLHELYFLRDHFGNSKLELEAFEQVYPGYLYDIWLPDKIHAASIQLQMYLPHPLLLAGQDAYLQPAPLREDDIQEQQPTVYNPNPKAEQPGDWAYSQSVTGLPYNPW